MPSQSMIRSLKSFLITATFLGCSHSSYGQQSIPPIDMTLTQFNQGRPSNFYSLADATEGYEAVCDEVLAALNEPYPSEPYAEYNEPYSKYLLRSRLSVPWMEKPRFLPNGDRYMYDIRHATVDMNNDGEKEDLIVAISNLSSFPMHTFGVATSGVLPVDFSEMNTAITEVMIASEAFVKGRAIVDQVGPILREKYEDDAPSKPDRQSVGSPFLEIIEVQDRHYALLTNARVWEEERDVIVFDVGADLIVSISCRLTSRFRIVN